MPRTTDRPERLYLRVTEPLRAELEQVAAEDGRTLDDLARWVLRDFLIRRLAEQAKRAA
jgi:hypothetical protein